MDSRADARETETRAAEPWERTERWSSLGREKVEANSWMERRAESLASSEDFRGESSAAMVKFVTLTFKFFYVVRAAFELLCDYELVACTQWQNLNVTFTLITLNCQLETFNLI